MKKKPPTLHRAYSLQEAYDKFGHRTYTDVVYTGERRLFGLDHEGIEQEIGPRSLHINGIVISSGVIQVRIHEIAAGYPRCEYDAYVTLEDLLKDWQWLDGTRCGVEYCTACHGVGGWHEAEQWIGCPCKQ